MLDHTTSAASGTALSFLSQSFDEVRGGHASADRLQETLAQHVEAASVKSFGAADTTAIERLASSILGQAAIHDAPELREKIGMRVAELLKGSSPDSAEAHKPPRFRPPHEPLAENVGKAGAGALPRGDWSAPASGPDASMEALWKEHVIDQLSEDGQMRLGWNPAFGEPRAGLLRMAQDYLKKHPEETPASFFKPFRDMLNNEISIPAELPRAINRGLIPFDLFRNWITDGVQRIENSRRREHPVESGYAQFILPRTIGHVNENLRAAFSPLALGLLEAGQLSAVRLAEWIGLQVNGADDNAPAVDDNAPAVKETHLVQRFLLNEAVTQAVPDAKVLRDPEILRKLADAGVPGQHVARLLSVAGVVAWEDVQAEVDRMIERYTVENPTPTFSLNIHNGNLPSGPLVPQDFRARMDALREETQGRMDPLRDEAKARMASYQRLVRLGPLAQAWMVTAPSAGAASPSSGAAFPLSDATSSSPAAASPSSADASSSGPLLWTLLPFSERVESWSAEGLSIDQQYWAGRFLINGLDEASARQIVQANAAHPDRLQAWQGCDAGMDLRPWLDGSMKEAVQRWLTDQTVSAEALALLPGMIRCDLSVDQIDALIRSPISIIRLNTVFGAQAQTPMRIGAGLLTAAALYDRVNDGGISEDELQEEAYNAQEMSRLRRAAAYARDQLRARLHAMEAIRAEVSPDTPAARQCDTWIQAWRGASESLRELLQSPLEDQLQNNPRQVEETLSNVFSNLAFSSVGSTEPNTVDGAALRA